MRVNRPRNVSDQDLVHDNPPVDLPLSKPTTMSYYLQRIKLADICRSVVDVMPLSNLALATIDYQDVIALDDKFEAFFQDLPIFLKTDDQSRAASEPIVQQYPQIQVQRYALGMIGHTRRCKLHQPFLIRGSVDDRYAYSRKISLRSARCVIRQKRLVENQHGTVLAANVKLTGVVYHVFMATIVLVMDLCFNKSEGSDAARKAEVMEACKILEEAKAQSRMASEFLESLMDILRKHKVRLHNPPCDKPEKGVCQDAVPPGAQVHTDANAVVEQEAQQFNPWPMQDNPQNHLSDFGEIWKDYVEFGPNMEMPEWDTLFSDLDSRFT